jgi:O-antigen ligase
MSSSETISQTPHFVPATASKYTRGAGLWLFPYLGTILVGAMAGSGSYRVAGVDLEHLLLAASLALASLYLLDRSRFQRLEGVGRLGLYLLLLCLALTFAFLSSLRPGPTLVGTINLLYWVGLIMSIALGGLAALCGRISLVLSVVAIAQLPVLAALLQPTFPFLSAATGVLYTHELHMGRATGLFSNPNWSSFAMFVGIGACVGQYFFTERRAVRILSAVMAIAFLWGCFLTESRAGMLVSIFALGAGLFLWWRKSRKRWPLAIAIVCLTVAFAYPVYRSLDFSALSGSRIFSSRLYRGDSFRFRGLTAAWDRFEDLVVLGEGMGEFKNVSYEYVDILDKAPHNQVLGVWVEWGFVALVLLYLAHGWVVWRGFRVGLLDRDARAGIMLGCYAAFVLFQQLHIVNSPAGCALAGLSAGYVLSKRPAKSEKGTER